MASPRRMESLRCRARWAESSPIRRPPHRTDGPTPALDRGQRTMTPRQPLWGLIAVSACSGWPGPRAWARGRTRPITTCSRSTATGATSTTRRCWRWSSRLGLALAGGAVSTFALRLGFVVLFAGSTWLMARLTSRFFGPWAGVLAAFAPERLGLPHGGGQHVRPARRPAPVLLAPDARPARRGLRGRPTGSGPGSGVGLAWGGAMLSKYHAVFLPAGALALHPGRALGPAGPPQARPLPGVGDRRGWRSRR